MPDLDNVEEAWTAFHIEYGRTMLAWAMIESELATLFSMVTRISPDMAIKIFYAPRSFKGRTDIFKSALPVCKIPEEAKKIARSLIKKADQYSDCRNKFAHDQPLLHQISAFPPNAAQFNIVLVDAKGQFQNNEEKKRYVDAALSTEDVAEIAKQFMALAYLIRDTWIEMTANTRPSLDTLHERLAALPSLPPPRGQSQPSAERERPPRSSGE
jgi:hypothetical protein